MLTTAFTVYAIRNGCVTRLEVGLLLGWCNLLLASLLKRSCLTEFSILSSNPPIPELEVRGESCHDVIGLRPQRLLIAHHSLPEAAPVGRPRCSRQQSCDQEEALANLLRTGLWLSTVTMLTAARSKPTPIVAHFTLLMPPATGRAVELSWRDKKGTGRSR